MKALVNKVIQGNIDTLTVNDLNNSYAFLKSLEVNDVARAPDRGYLQDPFYNRHKVLFGQIADRLEAYVAEKQAEAETLKVPLINEFNWETSKKRINELKIVCGYAETIDREAQKAIDLLKADKNPCWDL